MRASLMALAMAAALPAASAALSVAARAALSYTFPGATAGTEEGAFRVVGNKVYDSTGRWTVFRGISMSCTEFSFQPLFPEPVPGEETVELSFDSVNHPRRRVPAASVAAEGKQWPGIFAWENCFVGVPSINATLQLRNETDFLQAYLSGSNFATSPRTVKVPFASPYDEVIDMESPQRVVPIIRVPMAAATYLYPQEANELGPAGYQQAIDMIVEYFTSRGVAVILDDHSSCAGGRLYCKNTGPMSLRNFGNESGTIAFWRNISSRYKDNHLVMYELYNEPHVWYQAYYGGDPVYVGMAEMLDAIRAITPTGLVVVAGHAQWAHDAAGQVAFWLQYSQSHNGSTPANIMFNFHPYQGVYQGLEHSVRSTMRLVLAAKQYAPVIFTELGQYCCSQANNSACEGPQETVCKDHNHGDWFVENLLNMAAQLDVSYTIWAWAGPQPSHHANCTTGSCQCGFPMIRDNPPGCNGTETGCVGILSNGTWGGANIASIWERYIAAPVISVQDTPQEGNGSESDYEPPGFLPRPCIAGEGGFGLGAFCGWPYNTSAAEVDKGWNSLWNQSITESVLPGLPPSGQPSSCTLQACPGWTCNTSSPIIPMPQPCAP